MRDVLNSVTPVPGVQCVMMDGMLLMPLLSVDSWDIPIAVSSYSY